MNDKFFDLAKEKQDRMINGAIAIFALNGYQHASTDDMVKVAGISKGLWFHYFGNKIGLFEFVCNYSVRYFTMELASIPEGKSIGYYEAVRQILVAIEHVMKAYPYMPLFLHRIMIESDIEASAITNLVKEKLNMKVGSILKNAEHDESFDKSDRDAVSRIVFFTLQGIMLERYGDSSFDVDKTIKDLKNGLKKLQSLLIVSREEKKEQDETVAS